MQPTGIRQRVELLDILRGIAIFGMFTVNMTGDVFWSDKFAESTLSLADSVSLVLVDLFTNGKFITIFSFLFGIGFFIQSERASHRGVSVPAFWCRRLAGLLMIGLVAEACTLPSWILIDYSVFGLGLLLVYRLPPRWIMVAAIGCFAIPKIWGATDLLWVTQAKAVAAIPVSVHDAFHDSADAVFRAGSFIEIGAANLVHVWVEFTHWTYYLWDLDLLGLMLIGLFTGRIGAVWNREIQVTLARKTLPWLLGVGFAGCAASVVMKQWVVGEESPALVRIVTDWLTWPIGMPVLGLGYVAAITLLVDRSGWHQALVRFAPIGRMALSNYLFTGFVLAALSFQWGLGLYGEIFPATGLMIVFVMLPFQMIFSRWWLSRYAYGPIEWLWRAWTYGKLPSMGGSQPSSGSSTA